MVFSIKQKKWELSSEAFFLCQVNSLPRGQPITHISNTTKPCWPDFSFQNTKSKTSQKFFQLSMVSLKGQSSSTGIEERLTEVDGISISSTSGPSLPQSTPSPRLTSF
jgi:hypothetical protein